jgi:uncharacterized membrane protein (DUF2068 family)
VPTTTPITLAANSSRDAPVTAKKKKRSKNARGLLLVGLFKLSKAIFFGALALGAMHLVHRNIGDLVLRATEMLRLDPEGHFVSLLLDKADLIDSHHLRQAGMLSLGYASCCLVEGVGLIMCQVWAEYFTVVLTVAALPYEIYEIVHQYTHFKLGLLGLNLAVLVYLLWLLRRKRQDDAVGSAV